MKKLLIAAMLVFLLSGCSGDYSKYFSEPVNTDYLNGGKEIDNMEILFENGDSLVIYDDTALSFSENRFLNGTMREYGFEYIVPGKKDEEKGNLKYTFRSPHYDGIVSGKDVFYLGLGENAVSGGISDICVYENAVYVGIYTESCENPKDFSAEEFDFGPNYHYFVSWDSELIEKLDSINEKICQRAPVNVKELSDEEFYAHAKELWGYSEEQIELCVEANVPKARILRPFMGEPSTQSIGETSDGKYRLELFGFGFEYRLPGKHGYDEDVFYLPCVTNEETGKMTFIPEANRYSNDYCLGIIGSDRIFCLSEDSVKIYSIENPSELLAEAKPKNEDETIIPSAFSPKGSEKLYIFNTETAEIFNESFDGSRDYSRRYKIDVFEKDGSFIKTIDTGIPVASYFYGIEGISVPKNYGGIKDGEENLYNFMIDYVDCYSFDFETEEIKQILPQNVEISAKKGENGKYYLEKNGEAISAEIYESIIIRKSHYWEDETEKDDYYAVCAFEDGTDMRLFRNKENQRKPLLLESPDIRFDIFLSDGTLINEKPVQNFNFYVNGDGDFWGGNPNTMNLSGYSDNCYYSYSKSTKGTEKFELILEKAEDKINEYGFVITEKYYPGFYGKNHKMYGVKNPSGKVIAETAYLNIEMPFEDRIILWEGDDWDYTAGERGCPVLIDTEGRILTDEYDNLYFEFTEDGRYIGIASVMLRDKIGNWTRDYRIIDKDGNKLFEIKAGERNYLYLEVDSKSGKLIGHDDEENYYEYEIEDYLMKP